LDAPVDAMKKALFGIFGEPTWLLFLQELPFMGLFQ
jgi:hypothetical protein